MWRVIGKAIVGFLVGGLVLTIFGAGSTAVSLCAIIGAVIGGLVGWAGKPEPSPVPRPTPRPTPTDDTDYYIDPVYACPFLSGNQCTKAYALVDYDRKKLMCSNSAHNACKIYDPVRGSVN